MALLAGVSALIALAGGAGLVVSQTKVVMPFGRL